MTTDDRVRRVLLRYVTRLLGPTPYERLRDFLLQIVRQVQQALIDREAVTSYALRLARKYARQEPRAA